MSQFFASGGQSDGVSTSASALPMEYSGLVAFWMDWLDLLAVQVTIKSLPTPPLMFKSISSSVLCLLYGPALTAIHDHSEDHSLDYVNLCQQSNVSAF